MPLGKKDTYVLLSSERELRNGHEQDSFSVPTVRERGYDDNGDTGSGTGARPTTESGDGIFSLVPFPNNPLGAHGLIPIRPLFLLTLRARFSRAASTRIFSLPVEAT
jgi:hypothetical protein